MFHYLNVQKKTEQVANNKQYFFVTYANCKFEIYIIYKVFKFTTTQSDSFATVCYEGCIISIISLPLKRTKSWLKCHNIHALQMPDVLTNMSSSGEIN